MKAFHEVRSYDSNFMVWSSNYQNISFLAHWHNEIELIYIRSGSAKISITDHIFTAHEGDLILCDSGNIHYCDSYGMDNSLDFIIFDPNIISSLYQTSNFSHPMIKKEQLIEYELEAPLFKLFNTLDKELTNKEPYYQEIVKSCIREFWFLLKRKLPRNDSELPSQNKRLNMLYDLQQLLSYLDEHYSENITLEFAAKQMNFSSSHFSKVFKKLTGINFVNYLNMIRIEHAANQLKNTPDRILDIALSCGFNNIRNFNRVFKKMTGYTPTQFSKLPNVETFYLNYYNRKSAEKRFSVDKTPITIIKNNEKNILPKKDTDKIY